MSGKWDDPEYRAAYQREYYQQHRARLLANVAAYRQAHREELNARSLEYQRAHPEKTRERKERWAKANPERVHKANRAWRERNIDAVRAKNSRWQRANPEKARAKQRRYQKNHPEWKRQVDVVYHARRRAASGRGIKRKEWADLLHASGGYCTYCGRHGRMSLDHVEPIARGGSNDLDNAVVACRKCNSSKNDTPVLIWLFTRVVA